MKNHNKYIIFLIGHMLVILLVCLEGLGLITEFLSAWLIISICLINILILIRTTMLFTPLLFPEIYLLLFGLYELKLRTGMGMMAIQGKLVIVSCMFVWTLLCLGSKNIFVKIGKVSDYKFNVGRLKSWLLLLTTVSLSMLLYEWFKAGGVPALQANAETFRMSVSQSGMTHTLAIMIKLVAVLIEVYWISKIGKKKSRCKLFIFLYAIAMIAMWGTANRGELVFAPVIGIIVLWTKYPPSRRMVALVAIAGLVVLAIFPAVRGYGMYGKSYFTQYSQVSTYQELGWLMPLYGTLAYNFEILNRLFETFSQHMQWGYGQYAIFCHIPFLHIGEELWVVQNRIWNNGFYGALTSTYMGSWYADFSYLGCYFGTALICVANLFAYGKMVEKKSMGALVVYAYLFYVTLVGCYSDAFNFVFICYEAVIALVMNQCEQKIVRRS
jgi:hypothetical protein